MSVSTIKKTLLVSMIATGLFTAASSQAATQPSAINAFTAEVTEAVLSVKSKGWHDAAFGDMGWTHSSGWGSFSAYKGDTVRIKVTSTQAGLHPGITVWYRGIDDTAPDSYVVDHFYPQNANFVKIGVTDETSGEKLGNIVMRHIVHAYDGDNTVKVGRMKPIKDGVAGEVNVSFKAPKNHLGQYMFVVGGINPDEGVDTSLKYDMNVSVTVTKP